MQDQDRLKKVEAQVYELDATRRNDRDSLILNTKIETQPKVLQDLLDNTIKEQR